MIRIEILTEVGCLYQHLCYPREVHLDAFYCIFGYIHNSMGNRLGRMKYDLMYEPTDDNSFEVYGRYLDKWNFFTLVISK